MVDNDPNTQQARIIEVGRFPEHEDFLRCVVEAGTVLDMAGIPRDDWQVISGGSVVLRQLACGIRGDRIPTDLDIVMTYVDSPEAHHRLHLIQDTLHELERDEGGFSDTRIITEPRTHHGYVFSNPILETRGSNGFPLDILSVMHASFPPDAPIPRLRNVEYDFPNHRREIFDSATTIQIGGKDVRVAHPGYVAFYKASMNRNGHSGNGISVPKQDDADLRRLAQMGLMGPEIRDIMTILAGDDPELLEQLDFAIASKLSQQ